MKRLRSETLSWLYTLEAFPVPWTLREVCDALNVPEISVKGALDRYVKHGLLAFEFRYADRQRESWTERRKVRYFWLTAEAKGILRRRMEEKEAQAHKPRAIRSTGSATKTQKHTRPVANSVFDLARTL